MNSYKIDIAKMDSIIKKTIEVINNSKAEIYDIAESARGECKRLEEELQQLKEQVDELILTVEMLDAGLMESRRKLMFVSKNFNKYSQDEIKEAYETADNFRIQLAVKREQEQYLIKRRNDLEIRFKEAYRTLQKAESLIEHVVVALGYLTGDLQEISQQLEGIQQRQQLGVRIIKAQEEERQRVARDIHDGPAQSMSNVVIKAEICERLIDVDIDKAKEELKNLKTIVRESLQEVRKIIYNLRPMSLDDLGLIPTLQRYLLTFQEDTGISVSFKTMGYCNQIRPEISLTIFRVVQEAVSNINKHANANSAIVNIELSEKDIKLIICDDGRGFIVNKLKAKNDDISSGFGLLSLHERIELLDGEFKINSEPGRGTRLYFIIPLVQEEGSKDGKNKSYDC